jgi:DNA-binding PadR family transcriptional regulator
MISKHKHAERFRPRAHGGHGGPPSFHRRGSDGWPRHGHHGSSRGHGGSGRARRGDVRAAILALLAERPMHGYEMIQELQERTRGVWRPSPGSVYPALQLLEDEGLIRGQEANGKRLYELSDAGRADLERRGQERAPWETVADGVSPGQRQLRDAIGQITAAAQQVAWAGTEAQTARAVEALVEARRRLYTILAEDA